MRAKKDDDVTIYDVKILKIFLFAIIAVIDEGKFCTNLSNVLCNLMGFCCKPNKEIDDARSKPVSNNDKHTYKIVKIILEYLILIFSIFIIVGI